MSGSRQHENIEPINERCDGLLDFSVKNLGPDKVLDEIDGFDDNAVVYLLWRNATICARAATVRAWYETDQLLRGA